jgi:hypothetical protein
MHGSDNAEAEMPGIVQRRAKRSDEARAAGQCRKVITLMPGRGGKGDYMGCHRNPGSCPERGGSGVICHATKPFLRRAGLSD